MTDVKHTDYLISDCEVDAIDVLLASEEQFADNAVG